jgi:CRISPR-associated protein Csb1
MSNKLSLEQLRKAVQTGAAARSRVALQPAGGEGTKVFPPTYAGAVYATEKRRVPGHPEPVDCVLLDSVQSQANRMEEALQQAIDEGRFTKFDIRLPLVEVDFTGFWDVEKTKKHPVKKDVDLTVDLRLLEPVGKVTSLQVPHRIVDAILRDSVVVEDGNDNGKSFRAKAEKDESSYGQRLRRVSAQNATALFELCPTALLLGMWDSTGPKGGLGAKFERAMVSEIVGINAVYGVRTSSRIDPIINKNPILYSTPSGGWTVLESEAINEGTAEKPRYKLYGKKLSELNLGNFPPSFGRYTKGAEGPDPLKRPSLSFDYRFRSEGRELTTNQRFVSDWPEAKEGAIGHGGVTITSAEQSIVLSFAALRRLKFPTEKLPEGKTQEDVNNAARMVLAALGLCAAALAAEAGLDLRSRCLLWPVNSLSWEMLGKPGEKEEGITLEADDAIKLLKDAIDAAKAIGLPWREQPLQLVPSDRLVTVVAKSQQLALAQAGEGGE